MFTGLIEDTGRVTALLHRGEAALLTVDTALPTGDIALGDSVAVNGACLTVTARSSRSLTFDVSPESLTRTTIGTMGTGTSVNLERALRLGDRFGGHIVAGHVDCTGRLTRCDSRSGNHQLQFTIPPDHCRYLVEKGSVTIDGISLTVNEVARESFTVNIIPHTYGNTTLKQLTIGDRVNIETDIIGKYVERLTAPWKPEGGLTMKTLAENGFI